MNKNGLTSAYARELLNQYGPNLLPSKKGYSVLRLLYNQLKNLLALLLTVAALISFAIGDPLDSALILVILCLNVILGFWQEYKASKEIEALKKLEVLSTRVLRDGQEQQIPAYQLVPGDVIILEAGAKVPSDAVLFAAEDLTVDESSLTGESAPVVKTIDEETRQIFFGTHVLTGKARAWVVKTGSQTRFGQIALSLVSVKEEPTALEAGLSVLAKQLTALALIIAIASFILQLYYRFPKAEAFFSSTALMVAAVPEGLPAVITIVLALGVGRMYKHKTLVRKMSAIESLGATTVILSDKTGTLTKNQMEVKEVCAEKGLGPALLHCAVACNGATVVFKKDHGSLDLLGDTTDAALLAWAMSKGVDINAVRASGKILEEQPFSLKSRKMSVLWQEGRTTSWYVKGAPEVILQESKLTPSRRLTLQHSFEQMASKGLRVLAFARQAASGSADLEFLGLIGIADAARPEAAEAVARAQNAGIRVVMVTGDNELTAKAIAEDVGLIKSGEEIITGEQLSQLTDQELEDKINLIRIFARVIPEHKLRVVQAFQRRGEVVAVTGDGVNDALALKQSNVGVAMGKMGTDVAKEAADVVILDDNFATITKAIEQGRVIYSNILKVVKYLLAGNLSEVLLILVAVGIGLPSPLLPAQILWINFVTDGLPALSLAADKPSARIMAAPPRDPKEAILSSRTLTFIAKAGVLISLLCLMFFWYFYLNFDLQFARAITFTVMVFLQMMLVFTIRRHHSLFSNRYLLASVVSIIFLQLLILFWPPLQTLFKII